MSKPIFVVGVHRSGTTWLANILCQHGNISGIQNKQHFGIYESAFFESVMDNFGDLKNDNNFNRLVKTFTTSDFFILSGLDKNIFYKKRPKTYHEFFRVLMDHFAEKEKVDFWLEKTPVHTLYLKKMSGYYPDAKFVSITRDILDTIKSTIKMHHYKSKKNKFVNSKICHIIYFTYRYVKYYKCIENFSKKSKSIMNIDYNDLKKSKSQVIINICKFLDIEFQQSMLEEKFKPNTSFIDDSERKVVLTSSYKRLVKLMASLFTILPFKLYSVLDPIERIKRKSKMPTWFYLITKEEQIEKRRYR